MRTDLALSRDHVLRLGMGEVVVLGGFYSVSPRLMVNAPGVIAALARGEAVKTRVLGTGNELHEATLQCDELARERVAGEPDERADDLRALEDALILACVASNLDLPDDYTIDDLEKRGLVYCQRDHTDEYTSGLTKQGEAWLVEQLGQLPGRLLA